jgi:putative endonuclease
MYYVYILFSQRLNIFYKGITQNPQKRLFEHNNDLSRFTAGKGPWDLVYLEEVNSKKDALLREKAIKKLNRRSILLLIKKYSENLKE